MTAFRFLLSHILLVLLASPFSAIQAQDPTSDAPSSSSSQSPPSLTVYYLGGQGPQATLGPTGTQGNPSFYTALQAYNPATVIPAPAPDGDAKPAGTYTLQLGTIANAGGSGVSIPIEQGFMGFSVDMSVANQVLGKNS
jgi:hypothetical protein